MKLKTTLGFGRIDFPEGMDANDVLVKSGKDELARFVRETEEKMDAQYAHKAAAPQAEPPSSTASSPETGAGAADGSVTVRGDRITFTFADRIYQADGLAKNRTYGALTVTFHAYRGQALFSKRFEVYSGDKDRAAFVRACASALEVEEDVVYGDFTRMYKKLKELQDRQIEAGDVPKTDRAVYPLTPQEREEAFAEVLLKPDPLLAYALYIEDDAGVVGERVNIEASILAAVTRLLDDPIHVIYQAPSAAGKSTLMKAVLDTVPDEFKEVFTEISKNAFFYFEDGFLVHKTIGIMEDFGIGEAGYSLKTLLTDGFLKKASTARDPDTGLNQTKQYFTKGPVQAFTSSNNAWIIEDFQNRAVILVLSGSVFQTKAVQDRKRRARTLDGMRDKKRWEKSMRVLQNAHRTLRRVLVVNPYVDLLTFPSDSERTRRDFDKYLSLIEANALLCQYNRPVFTADIEGERVECIAVTKEDIRRVNPIAEHIFAASLDDLGPITRKLLGLIRGMVNERCAKEKIDSKSCAFSRRDVREHTKWSADQIRRHMERLVEFELVQPSTGRPGQAYLYRLDERPEDKFPGLIDPDTLPEHPGVRP